MSGGLCLYQEKGRSYSCECSIGYTKLRAKNSKFRRCEGMSSKHFIGTVVESKSFTLLQRT